MNGVPDEILVSERRRNILINYIGQRAAAYLIDACAPRDPLEFSTTELFRRLEEKFEPAACVSTYRVPFYTRLQKPNEKISDYCTVLQQLANKCDFGNHRDQALRDRLQSGVSSTEIKRKLFSMPVTAIFEQTRNTALREEVIDEQIAQQARLIPPINHLEVGAAHIQYKGDLHANGVPVVNTPNAAQAQQGRPATHPGVQRNFCKSWWRNPGTAQQGNWNQTRFQARNHHETSLMQSPTEPVQKPTTKYGTNPNSYEVLAMWKLCSNQHAPATCPARNSQCRTCNKTGHWSSQCRQINWLQSIGRTQTEPAVPEEGLQLTAAE